MECSITINKIITNADYSITVIFSDGVQKNIDFKPYLLDMPLLEKLKNISYFRKAKVYEGGAGIFWDNGYDVCPNNLRFYM